MELNVQFFFVLALVAFASAGPGGYPQGGQSDSTRKQDEYGNYAFHYQVMDGAGASNGRWEEGNAEGVVKGSYNIIDIDGRQRTVEYVADENGFRARIKTNEPGTANSFPASAMYQSTFQEPISHGRSDGYGHERF